MLKFSSIFFSSLLALQAQATIIAEYLPSVKPTKQHIIFAGTGGELETMFLESAMGKASIIKENDPTAKILIISNVNKDLDKEREYIERSSFQTRRADNISIGVESIGKEAGELPIASLSIYSHSAITYGVHLYKGGRYSSKNPAWLTLKGKFTDKGYIYLYGCNTGYELAPTLAKLLSVPVAGALTSSEFQYLDQSSKWKYSQPVSNIWGPEVSENSISLSEAVNCRTGACIRMQPLFRPYSGYWGDFKTATFPGFKFFCGDLESVHCEKIMALSLFSQMTDIKVSPNADYATFKLAITKFMCPRFNDIRKSEACENKLLALAEKTSRDTYSPVEGQTLFCDANSCEHQFKCKRASMFNSDQKCELVAPGEGSTSFVDEYRRYLRGFLSK